MNITFVTGLWDLERDKIEGFSRDFSIYTDSLNLILEKIDNVNFVIYTTREIASKLKVKKNFKFVYRDLEHFDNFQFLEKTEKIRSKKEWYSQARWLENSPQAKLKYYNPIVMSKMFMLHDAKCYNFFNSDYFCWIDAGLSMTVDPENIKYAIKKGVNDFLERFFFICYPYETDTEIHGFNKEAIDHYSNDNVKYVCRGGFFGGHKNRISLINDFYYKTLDETLNHGFMGTEESVFTILSYRYLNHIDKVFIEENGLVGKFFSDVLNDKAELIRFNKKRLRAPKTSCYILTYNLPDQLEYFLKKSCQKLFKESHKVYLLNNSTKHFDKYDQLCEEYNLEQIKFDNIGICRARQFAAEHFDKTDADYYIFFEDDMIFNSKDNGAKNYFKTYTENAFSKISSIMEFEDFDFLKLSFAEFYGNNTQNWAFHNMDTNDREKYFKHGRSIPPLTKYNNIKLLMDIPYAVGSPHYCNWPILFSKEGNRKVFLENPEEYPLEQSWMRKTFTNLQIYGKLKTGTLLANLIFHDRKYHYSKNERREN